MTRDQLQRIARLLDVAFDALEERDGLALHPAYRGAVRAVAAWEDIDSASAAAHAAPLPTKGYEASWLAWLLVAKSRGLWTNTRDEQFAERLAGIARAAFGDRGDALAREAWEGP